MAARYRKAPERGDGLKRGVPWWYLITLAVIITGGILTIYTAQQQDQAFTTDLLIRTRIAAGSIDVSSVKKLTGTTADLVSPDYLRLKDEMIRIRNADPALRFTYLMGEGPDGVFFYVDSEPPGSDAFSFPGQVYNEASPALREAFSMNREMTEGPVSDRWGTWVSALVPVRDPDTGQLVAMLGMDVDAGLWYTTILRESVSVITAVFLILVLVATFGVSERRKEKEQQRLAASENKFSRVFAANPAMMAVTTLEDDIFLDVNSAFEKTSGYSRDEVIGKTPAGLALFVDPVGRSAVIARLRGSGVIQDIDVKIRTKGGDMREGLFSALIIDIDGTPRMLTVMLDITERKRAGDALKKINQKLIALTRLTRTNLMDEIYILRGYLELAGSEAEGQAPIIEKIEGGERAIKVIADTTEIIKDYQDLGAKPPVWQNVKMSVLLGLSHVDPGGIQVDVGTGLLEIYSDPLLEKAWQGLFENSIIHGGRVTRIRVSNTITPNGMVITFEDDGVGVPVKRKEHIFDQDERPRAGVRGLFFIREILDITNITIRETGEPGKGARFEITVPRGGYRIEEEKGHNRGGDAESPDTR